MTRVTHEKVYSYVYIMTGHERGEPWTIESLIEHARKIENNKINAKDVQAV
jgi:hypothetical protein